MATTETDFTNLTKEEAIQRYLDNLNHIQTYAERNNVQNFEVMVLQSFKSRTTFAFYRSLCRSAIRKVRLKKRLLLNLLALMLALFVAIRYKHEMSALFLRKVQHFIYPSMKVVRKAAIPILSNWPALTDFYEESCLVHNPYFQVGDSMDCSSCRNRLNILDLTDSMENERIFEDAAYMPFFIRVR